MAAAAVSSEIVGLTATAAIAQFQPVQASGAPAVAAGNVLGFATIAAASGVRVPVGVGLTVIAIAGAAIAAGAAVEVHTTVTQVVTKSAGIAIGRALTAAGAAGDQIEVSMIPN
jgi:Uncharacterized conserved protein (DUF2190)